jgi:hypothetical protein
MNGAGRNGEGNSCEPVHQIRLHTINNSPFMPKRDNKFLQDGKEYTFRYDENVGLYYVSVFDGDKRKSCGFVNPANNFSDNAIAEEERESLSSILAKARIACDTESGTEIKDDPVLRRAKCNGIEYLFRRQKLGEATLYRTYDSGFEYCAKLSVGGEFNLEELREGITGEEVVKLDKLLRTLKEDYSLAYDLFYN